MADKTQCLGAWGACGWHWRSGRFIKHCIRLTASGAELVSLASHTIPVAGSSCRCGADAMSGTVSCGRWKEWRGAKSPEGQVRSRKPAQRTARFRRWARFAMLPQGSRFGPLLFRHGKLSPAPFLFLAGPGRQESRTREAGSRTLLRLAEACECPAGGAYPTLQSISETRRIGGPGAAGRNLAEAPARSA